KEIPRLSDKAQLLAHQGPLLWARRHRSPATGTLLDIGIVARWIVTVIPDRCWRGRLSRQRLGRLDIDLGRVCIGGRIGIPIGIPIRPPIGPPVGPDADPAPDASPAVPPVEAVAAMEAVPPMEAMAATPMAAATPGVAWAGTGAEHCGQGREVRV